MKKFVLFVLCVFLFASCAPKAAVTPVAKEPVDISFLHYFSEPLTGGINEMVTVFNEKQSDYLLKAVPLDHEAFKLSIVQDLKSVSPPEVYSNWAGARVKSVILDLEPIDDLWIKGGLDAYFDPVVVDSAVTYNEHKYLVPITQHLVIMYYNIKVFKDLELTPPKTWDEFQRVCAVVKAAGITPIALGSKNKWPAQFWFDYLLIGSAGEAYRNRLMTGKASYMDPEVEKVFGVLSEMIGKGYFSDKPEAQDWYELPLADFATGKSAMTLMGTWANNVLDNAPHNLKALEDYDYFLLPNIDAALPQISLGPIDGLVIPKNAKHVDGGKAVLSFMANVEAQKAMSQGSGGLSPNTQLDHSSYTPIQIKLSKDIEEAKGWAFNYDLSTPPEIAEIGLDLFKDFWSYSSDYKYLLKEANVKIEKVWDVLGRD